MYASKDVPTCKEITEEGATNTQVRLIYDFFQILCKNRGCGLYSGVTCSPENTVVVFSTVWVRTRVKVNVSLQLQVGMPIPKLTGSYGLLVLYTLPLILFLLFL